MQAGGVERPGYKMTPGVFAGPGGMKKAAPADGGNIKEARLVHSGCWSVNVCSPVAAGQHKARRIEGSKPFLRALAMILFYHEIKDMSLTSY